MIRFIIIRRFSSFLAPFVHQQPVLHSSPLLVHLEMCQVLSRDKYSRPDKFLIKMDKILRSSPGDLIKLWHLGGDKLWT